MKQNKTAVFLGLAFIVAGIVMAATKKPKPDNAQNSDENTKDTTNSVLGKRVKTVGEYAKARSAPKVDNGHFTNTKGTVKGEFGVIKGVVMGEDGYDWYKVFLDDPSKMIGRWNPVYVRSDVATPV